MIRYVLTEPEGPLRNPLNPRRAEVILKSADLHGPARLEVAGHDLLAAEIYDRLIGSYGFRGRSIEEETTPLDLHCALMVHFQRYLPELVEGQEILDVEKDV